MSTTKTWINWIALFVLLILFGIGAALWPSISANFDFFGGGNSSTQVPVEVSPIVIEIPVAGAPNVSLPGLEVSGENNNHRTSRGNFGVNRIFLGCDCYNWDHHCGVVRISRQTA